MAIIDKIKLSGQTFDIQDSNASKTVELTQAEYDALVTKDPNTYYIITDAEAVDLANYYTKTETDDLLDDKLDVTAYTPTDLSNYYTKSETSGATQIQTALNGKADNSTVNSLNNVVTAHTANTTVHVTAQDKSTWNAKSDFSGSYNDLSDKPTIPTVPTSNTAFTNDAGYITSDDISGKADTSAVTEVNDVVTAHTANTTIHVTAADKTNWNNKSDFSGNYNDLTNKPTIPTVPTNVSDFTNDAGYITSDDISGKTNQSDFTAHTANTTVHVTANEKSTWNAKSDFSGDYNDLTNKLSAGTNITIVDNVISAEGGGKAVSGGTNISITTGETADTINCTLNISNGTGGLSIKSNGASSASANHTAAFGQNTKATNVCAFAEGWGTTASGGKSHSEGDQTTARGGQSHAEGSLTQAIADHSHSEGYASSATSRVTTMVGITTPYGWNTRHSEGYATIADNGCTHTEGLSTKALNVAEHSSGAYNVSYTASTTWGDSGNTLFSVGNGTSDNARHNAFEIRQNGDIYCSDGTNDVKLQDTITATSANTTALGGLSLVKLTQAEYDALVTKDSNTLYVING